MDDSLEAPFGPMPDPESPDYYTFIERELSKGCLNYVDGIDLKEIDIMAKRLVIDEGHPNGVFEKLHSRQNLTQVRIFAEELIVKSAVHLPHSDLYLAVKRLEFVGTDSRSGL